MKTTILAMSFLLASLNAFAAEASSTLNCKSNGNRLSLKGSFNEDGVLTSTVRVSYDQASYTVENIRYAPSETPGAFYLVEDEAAALAKDEGIYFVPSSFYAPAKGSPEKFRRYFYLWLPTLDEKGEKSPILIRGTLSCE